uniref:Uncharacterized protein n=1 Tax=Oryza meridionalis TaxID=40149 RepID=A0A0E0FD53_9ORYZ
MPPPEQDKDKALPKPKLPKPKPKPKPEPKMSTWSASASAPEHDQTAGPYGTVRATTGKGEEKETLNLNLKERGRGEKEACSPERRWRPEERTMPSPLPSPPGRAARHPCRRVCVFIAPPLLSRNFSAPLE